MTQLTVRQCALTEVVDAPEFPQLIAEYEAESAMAGMPPTNAKIPLYRQLEAARALTAFGAWQDNTLIGFIGVLYHELPHYGIGLAVVESFFVTMSRRPTGAGLKLKRLAEEHAKALGSPGLCITAPVNSQLDTMLNSSKRYAHASNVYFMRFER